MRRGRPGELGEEETIWAAVGVLRAWIERYGVPQALYMDWKNVYAREPNAQEQMRGEVPVTQFGRMCQRWGSRSGGEFTAGEGAGGEESRDASGPFGEEAAAERDRQHAGANVYLEKEYLPEHNGRFARARRRGRKTIIGVAPSGRELDQDLPVGDRADDERRLGGAVRQPIFATSAREASAWRPRRTSEGVRRAEGRV